MITWLLCVFMFSSIKTFLSFSFLVHCFSLKESRMGISGEQNCWAVRSPASELSQPVSGPRVSACESLGKEPDLWVCCLLNRSETCTFLMRQSEIHIQGAFVGSTASESKCLEKYLYLHWHVSASYSLSLFPKISIKLICTGFTLYYVL